jgi:peptidoglycan/xylan/chitin deacetylase (PgdA/CDA1 family)
MTPVLRALDARRQPLVFFVRDDDAGWEDGALWALLDCMADTRVPIDLAVIPQATGQRLADALCARIDAAPGLLGVHQHGLAHTNHERVGRRCEFGHARAPMAQRKDLRQGRARLQTLFGHRLDDIFTPPWNRCASYTPALLCEVGLTALSRDRSAASQQDMPELRVDVDWCKYRRGTDDGGAALARAMLQAVRDRADDAEPLGLMLHHAQMGAADLQLLRLWLPALREHPLLRCVPMRRALAPRAPELH